MTDVLELAWAAGFFDGEGTTACSRGHTLVLSVAQKDRQPLECQEPPELVAVCFDCNHYWECADDNTVPICPEDRTEDRSHFVVTYRKDW
jgi:hypothetical protein